MKLIAEGVDGEKVTLASNASFDYCKKLTDDFCINHSGLYFTFHFIEECPDELKEGDTNE